jgi:pSer/pThr/pTyr-binding forkhead associated (FHA) protein/TolA-binding protein
MKGPYKSGAEENTFIKAYDDIERSSKGPVRGPEAYPLLEIVQGPKQGAWFTVAYQKELTLGRASTNSIMLEDNSVSRSHAVLQSTGHGFTVRDIGSRNGTFLNNKKIQGDMPVKHMDAIKVGIYTLRFLEEPSDEPYEGEAKEEHTPHTDSPAEAEPSAADLIADIPEVEPEPEPIDVGALEIEQPEEDRIIPQEQAPMVVPQAAVPVPVAGAKPPSKALRNLLILLVIFGLLGGGGFFAYRSGALDKLKAALGGGKTKIADKDKPKTTTSTDKPKVLTPQTDAPTAGQTVPVFVEADAKPVPAKVFYKEKELGTTPFRVSVQVPVGQPQELTAEYFLDGIGEKWTEKLSFQVQKQDEVVPANFQAKLGQLKVKALPKNGELYLEGKFPPGNTQAKPLKVNNLSFDTPVYLPYGSYVAEVRMPETLEGSTSTVNSVKYRREFEMSAAAPEFNLEASDEAIKTFPAQINTNPPGAELLVDGKKVGDTPFAGQLPTGRHKLTIRKEGFNDFEKELTIELNTPYTANFNLATSPAGEFINKGRQLLKAGQYNEAVSNLAEALKRNPEATELAQVHMLLGQAFLKTQTYDQALAYFQKAKDSPEYEKQADLGAAEAHAGLNQNDQALVKLINIVLNTKDEKINSDAETLYHKISPMKSVLYVASDPPGAQLSINGNPIGQATPVILSDLLVGSYRVSLQKDGFKPYESRVQVPLSAIKPVIVKLQPVQ